MYLGYLSTYRSLVHTRNFHQTAEALGISQSTVSQHIRRLEDFLGTQLIIRKHSGCELTPQALKFNDYADGILDLLERARDNLHADQLIVGASSNIGTYLLQPALSVALKTFNLDVDVKLEIDRNDSVMQKLIHHQIDLAFTEWWVPQPGFHSEIWREEPLVVIFPEKHPLATCKDLCPESLIDQALLGGEKATGTGRLLREQLGEVATHFSIDMNLGNTTAVIEGVRNGLGISIVQRSALDHSTTRSGIVAREFRNYPLIKKLYISNRENLDAAHPALRLREAFTSCQQISTNGFC